MYNGYMPPAGPWALGMPVIPAPGGHAAAAQPPQADILFLKQDSSIFRQSSISGRSKPVPRGPNSTKPNLFHHGETTYRIG